MQFQFEKMDYQTEAVAAVVKLFQGQPKYEEVFQLTGGFSPVVGNRLDLPHADIQNNLAEIQQSFTLPETELGAYGLNFTVEMETGTGKTYVYLRTIFTLNREYGWTKFVIVVPSVAIREGVLQSIRAMSAHFAGEFDKPVFNHFVYSRERLNRLRGFAGNQNIEILIINIDAFNKDNNVINRINESGEAPINHIRQTCPIVILDEPQNMESDQAKKSIESLNPLFILRYSATHRTPYHKIYSLNPIQAYNKKLVKQIAVHSTLSKNDVNGAYLVLKKIEQKSKGRLQAKVEIHFQDKRETKKKVISLSSNDDIFEKSGQNESYRHGFIVNGMDYENQQLSLSGGGLLTVGESNDAARDEMMKTQIRLTIEQHLEKERYLKRRGIKVLSLFFIDKVANYRNNGKFAQWFEEIYQNKTGKSAEGVHGGYFSQDKDTNGKTKADEDTYTLIMKDKEKLLSFDSPLRFIFSHSALREGWDNPNVFQICTLNETRSEIKKRQEIGRGLRLAVNQKGERVHDENINVLTVIPNESYESFAAGLQKEYEEDGITFSDDGTFKNFVKNADNKKTQIYRKGFMLDPYFQKIWEKIRHKTRYSVQFDSDGLIKNAAEIIKKMPEIRRPLLQIQKAVIHQGETDGVWGEEKSSRNMDLNIVWDIPDVLLEIQKKTQLTRQTIFQILKVSGRMNEIAANPQRFIDLASEKILLALNRLIIDGIQYEKLPEPEYEQSLADWKKMEENSVEFFKNDYTFEIDKKKSEKTIVENYILLDSQTENTFARDCENSDDVAFYFKLPGWFKVPTPIGNYNPDWAVVMKNQTQVYFVAETKNTGKGIQDGVDSDKLRETEQNKNQCAKQHFKTCDGVAYRVVEKLNELAEAEN